MTFFEHDFIILELIKVNHTEPIKEIFLDKIL